MATRLYLPHYATTVIPLTGLTHNGDWDVLPATIPVRGMRTEKRGTAQNVATSGGETAVVAVSLLAAIYVSPMLSAQSISGTFTSQIRSLESNVAADTTAMVVLRLVDQAGAHKSYLWNTPPASLASEFGTSATNRWFPEAGGGTGSTMTTQTAADGDHIVAEFGGKMFNTTNTSRTLSLTFGDNQASDLAVDQTTTAATSDPWIEFSMNISWLQTGTSILQTYELDQYEFIQTGGGEVIPTVGQLWPR